jgi:glycosyltransferase involved in cell wall biosynthesis
MKVAVIVHTLKVGGMERVATNLCDSFHEQGHSVDLIYLKNRKKELSPRYKDIPVRLFDLKKGVLITGIGILWFVMCKLLNIVFRKAFPIYFAYAEATVFKKELEELEHNSGKFDLLIFRGQGTFEHLWPIRDSRFVYVCENVQKKHLYGKRSSWIFKNLFEDRNVVCVSDGALKSFKDMVDTHGISPNKVVMLSNPNDFNKIRKDADSPEEAVHTKPYILGLGRLVPQKNFTLLVEAYDYARTHLGLTHDLVIVGKGKDEDKIRHKVNDLGLNEFVFFMGATSNPFPWYKRADLFVLSSKFEGLGMVLLESLACNTKVVSTDSKGGVRQIMSGELEKFLARETPEALAEKIMFSLDYIWDKEFDSFVQSTLNQYEGSRIVEKYIENFA